MPALKNNRHEKFALNIFKGMTQKAAALDAGYKESRIDVTASELVRNSKIKERLRELHKEAESSAVMTVLRRKERLSEIAEARISDFVSCDEHGTHIKIGLESTHSAAISEVKTRKEYSGKGATEAEMTRLKLHDPVRSIAELNKMGGDYPPSKIEVEPGEKITEALGGLLSRLRGYDKKD